MRTALLCTVLLLGLAAVAAAGSGELDDIVNQLKAAFTPEGVFSENARESLLAANEMLIEAEATLTSDAEVMAINALKSLVMYNMACLDALDGNADEAFVWLEGAVRAGYTDAEWMSEDPDLELLRSDPRFEELLEEASSIQVDLHVCTGGGCCCCGSSCCEAHGE